MPLDNTNWSATEADETTALLIRARSFIERGWCRNTCARDAAENPVDPLSERAVAWCPYGALIVAGMPFCHATHPAMLRLTAATGAGQVVPFNDGLQTVEPILAAFDRAIAVRANQQEEAKMPKQHKTRLADGPITHDRIVDALQERGYSRRQRRSRTMPALETAMVSPSPNEGRPLTGCRHFIFVSRGGVASILRHGMSPEYTMVLPSRIVSEMLRGGRG